MFTDNENEQLRQKLASLTRNTPRSIENNNNNSKNSISLRLKLFKTSFKFIPKCVDFNLGFDFGVDRSNQASLFEFNRPSFFG